MRSAFLAAILEEPDDDTHRLIFADWLEERDDPRGEFIRIQCRLAGEMTPEERQVLAQRERALCVAHEQRWRSELPSVKGVEWGDFCRGFVAAVRVANCTAFLSEAARIFTLAPVEKVGIRSVTFGSLQRLAASELLGRVRVLDLSHSNIDDLGVIYLAGSPHLTGLRELCLQSNRISDEGAQRLVRSPYLPATLRVNASRNPISRDGNEALRARFGG